MPLLDASPTAAARRRLARMEPKTNANEPKPTGRRRLVAAAAGRSGRSDISERIEEILAETAKGPAAP